MRKVIILLSVIMIFSAVSVVPAMAGSAISINIDGKALLPTDVHGNAVPPFVENGTTYVPVRAIASAFDLSIDWKQETRTVFIGPVSGESELNDYINIFIGGEEFIAKDVNGERVYPILRNGTTYLPIRAIGEALGKNVFWDNYTKTAILITPMTDEERAALESAVKNTSDATELGLMRVTERTDGGEMTQDEEIFPMAYENLCAQFISERAMVQSASFDGSAYYASVEAKDVAEGDISENVSRIDIYVSVKDGQITSERIEFCYGAEKSKVSIENIVFEMNDESDDEE